MNREEVERALRERLGITPEQVRERFDAMEPINAGVFTQRCNTLRFEGNTKERCVC